MKIDKTWPVTAAEQLGSQLRLAIRSGAWCAGAALPTVKALAAELSLNPNTVAAVYRDLAADGLVTWHRRGGTRVARNPLSLPVEERELLAQADRLIRLAQTQHRSGADMLRVIAGRWYAAGEAPFNRNGRYPLYDFLQRHDYDQA